MATIDGRTLDHKTLTHLRMQAVRRVVEDGERPSQVMESYGLCRTSIYPWLREFKDKGWEALAESISLARSGAEAYRPTEATGQALDTGEGPTPVWI